MFNCHFEINLGEIKAKAQAKKYSVLQSVTKYFFKKRLLHLKLELSKASKSP